MDLVALLRALNALLLLTRLLLALALIVVVSRGRRALGETCWRAWLAVAVVFSIVAVDNAALVLFEPEVRGLPADAPLMKVWDALYHWTYLLHAVLSAALPASLMALGGGGWVRVTGLVAIWVAVVVGALAVGGGALQNWDRLLDATRVLSFVGVPAYLGVLGLLSLGHLPELDRFLGAFIAVRTVYAILVPIQEVFFQHVGPFVAVYLWHLPQSLQILTSAIQLGIVLLLLRSLAAARPEPRAAAAPEARAGL
mgnify:CR=1 FL=1|jgi:hypothetical protein|nr:MAG: hypothetical protein DIU52_12860 [bacterium]